MYVYRKLLRYVFTILWLFTGSTELHAHELSNGYLTLGGENTRQLDGKLSLTPYDLEIEVKLDANFDGDLTWQEVTDSEPALQAYYSNILHFTQNDENCALTFKPVALDAVSTQTLITLPFQVTCKNTDPVDIHYEGVFEQDDTHKTLVTIIVGDVASSDVFSTTHRNITISGQAPSTLDTIKTFVYEGIIHIWIGIDHILFLIATLLTINLCRRDKKWVAESQISPVLKEALLLITAFTLAHSLTLTTTALGWYQPSSRWVEIGIAVSVLLTALNNIWPVVHRLGWITFAFGLLHGMGFASVFGELQASANKPLLTVASFNIGVEIGQLAIVILLVPLLLSLRHYQWYARRVMPLTSAVIALVALNWAVQRW
ncbi:HupE/UreJ family protein [Alteromonas pelagimontana]|uniref:HupE/UreJ family protein n=1 Tax=Alteromonas pelagimontana TaxID=1858656 RepID=A0A6M4MEX8_9ALTE|nr:HupE/UreJ family protein [Alteromonas pelagimontana]QJR81633.1 HupE/UreJ family protein [Alteromonas pelagimontana]